MHTQTRQTQTNRARMRAGTKTGTRQAASLHTGAGQRKYLTPGERSRFLAVADTLADRRLRALCLMLAHTGCRISEALALTVGAIDPDGGCLAIRCLKKRRRAQAIRMIPVPPVLLDALAGLHGSAAGDAGARLWPLSRSRAWFLIKEAMTRAGIPPGPHRTPKGLRHGFGLHAVRSGFPLPLIQRWLGHASLATTAIYLQFVGEEERAFAARMWH